MMSFNTIRERAVERWEALTRGDLPVIYLGTASCGRAAGALEVMRAVQETLAEHRLQARLVPVGCIGPCYLEPLLDIALPGGPRVSYTNVTPEKARQIVRDSLLEAAPLPKQARGHFGGPEFTAKTRIQPFFDQPMLKPQVRVILKNCGLIDPEEIDHYLAQDGYLGFAGALELGPEAVIAEVRKSGLRGRGGAGFPASKKMELCRAAPGERKYVICNADEGDPGAFMNRALIESDPHAVLEGMLIAGYAAGASRGMVYVRAEYPLAVERLKRAIEQMREYGLLGKNILGSGFAFEIEVREGAGAFVCGEETALIASLEGERGRPRPRPPYPASDGYNHSPTLINNTETLGTLPHILRNGGEWFQGFGTAGNHGTKTFSLVGKARRTGLIEVPLGMRLGTIVDEVGGGTRRPVKGVQTGGPLGGCLSAAHLDLPMDYESLKANGSMMGSGGLIVMDETTCMVDMARYFLNFSSKESCGNCTSCRVGTRVLVETLERITRGEGEPEDLELLRRTAETMEKSSLCSLGQSAANPVTSTLRNFLVEYEEHIEQKFCRAGVCPGMYEYHILPERCSGCGLCVEVCSSASIQGEKRQVHSLDAALCTQCQNCVRVCARNAIAAFPVSNPTPDELELGVLA